MAYADPNTTTPINPLGALGAIAAQAGALAIMLSLAPKFVETLYTSTSIENYTDDIEKPDKQVTPAKAPKPDQTKVQLPVPPVTHVLPPPVDFVPIAETGGETDRTPLVPPVIPDPPALIIEKPPVLTAAKMDPRYASNLQPDYPMTMIRAEIEGVAVVKVLIGTDGRVKEIVNVRADHADFFENTRRQALSKWRFKPATKDGVPVESWKEMTVRFQMPKGFD